MDYIGMDVLKFSKSDPPSSLSCFLHFPGEESVVVPQDVRNVTVTVYEGLDLIEKKLGSKAELPISAANGTNPASSATNSSSSSSKHTPPVTIKTYHLNGRANVTLEQTDFLYIGRGMPFEITLDSEKSFTSKDEMTIVGNIKDQNSRPNQNRSRPRDLLRMSRQPGESSSESYDGVICICRAYCNKVLSSKYGPVEGEGNRTGD